MPSNLSFRVLTVGTLTLQSGGLYIDCIFIDEEKDHHGIGPQAGWLGFHRRGSADTELMSAGACPGRTGLIFVAERLVSGLARTAAAAVLHAGRCGAGLPDMDRVGPSAIFADLGSQDGSGPQPGSEWLDDYGLDRPNDSVLVTDCRLVSKEKHETA